MSFALTKAGSTEMIVLMALATSFLGKGRFHLKYIVVQVFLHKSPTDKVTYI